MSLEKVMNIRVIIELFYFKMNLKPATLLDNKESYNYNKADLSAMIIFMRSVNWKEGYVWEMWRDRGI